MPLTLLETADRRYTGDLDTPGKAALARLPEEGGTLVWMGVLIHPAVDEEQRAVDIEAAGIGLRIPPTLVELAWLPLIVVPVIVAFSPWQSP